MTRIILPKEIYYGIRIQYFLRIIDIITETDNYIARRETRYICKLNMKNPLTWGYLLFHITYQTGKSSYYHFLQIIKNIKNPRIYIQTITYPDEKNIV